MIVVESPAAAPVAASGVGSLSPVSRGGVRRDCQHRGSPHVHGTAKAYRQDRCSCGPCRAAIAAVEAGRYRARVLRRAVPQRVPLVGSQRRLRALACLGWSPALLSARCGLSARHLQEVRSGAGRAWVTVEYAATVARLYDVLWDREPVAGSGRGPSSAVARTRAYAAGQGWVPPLAWDDDSIDDPAAGRGGVLGGREQSPCGTAAAARRHYRAGEPLDAACRAAGNRAARDRKTRRRAQAGSELAAAQEVAA